MTDETVSYDRQEWLEAGFTKDDFTRWGALRVQDPEEARDYLDGRLTLEVAEAWFAATKLEPCQVFEWLEKDFSLEQASTWIKAQLEHWDDAFADDAAEWRDAGVTPEDYAGWMGASVFELDEFKSVADAGLSLNEIRKWQTISYWQRENDALFSALADGLDPTDTANADQLHELFQQENPELTEYHLSVDDMLRWRAAGFSPDSDAEWVAASNGDEELAVQWRSAGLSPSDAMVWKEASVSLDEAKSWREAGFAPTEAKEWENEAHDVEEATAWRDAGFSVEQVKELEDEGIFDIADALEATGRSLPFSTLTTNDEPLYLLRPIATVASHHGQIIDEYTQLRPQQPEKGRALHAALRQVLTPSDNDEVVALFRGEWDDRLGGKGEGRKFGDELLESCEQFYLQTRRMLERNARRATMDPVALAEDIGTDSFLVEAFDSALSRMDEDGCGRLVAECMVLVGRSASRAWTKTGRKIKIEQAIKVFRTLERRAGVSPQGLWCKAVGDALQSQMWRL